MDRAANAVGRASRWAVRAGLVLGLIAVQPAHAQDFASRVVELDRLPKARPDIPVASDPNMLFYVQRSTNPNTVVYAARLDAAGKLDMAQPVEGFWRRFKSDGARVPLSFTERNGAYGVDVRRIDRRDDAVLANIVSYPDRQSPRAARLCLYRCRRQRHGAEGEVRRHLWHRSFDRQGAARDAHPPLTAVSFRACGPRRRGSNPPP